MKYLLIIQQFLKLISAARTLSGCLTLSVSHVALKELKPSHLYNIAPRTWQKPD